MNARIESLMQGLAAFHDKMVEVHKESARIAAQFTAAIDTFYASSSIRSAAASVRPHAAIAAEAMKRARIEATELARAHSQLAKIEVIKESVSVQKALQLQRRQTAVIQAVASSPVLKAITELRNQIVHGSGSVFFEQESVIESFLEKISSFNYQENKTAEAIENFEENWKNSHWPQNSRFEVNAESKNILRNQCRDTDNGIQWRHPDIKLGAKLPRAWIN